MFFSFFIIIIKNIIQSNIIQQKKKRKNEGKLKNSNFLLSIKNKKYKRYNIFKKFFFLHLQAVKIVLEIPVSHSRKRRIRRHRYSDLFLKVLFNYVVFKQLSFLCSISIYI